MLSGDAIIQAGATLTVGAIFLITLRKALGLRVTSWSVSLLLVPVYFWGVSIAMIFWGDMVERTVPPGGTLVSFTVLGLTFKTWEWYNSADFFFIMGIVMLIVVIILTQAEATQAEGRGVRW
jgi:hypothetical protein